jgi:hypothetical protein
MFPAIQHNFFVIIADKKVNPVHYRKAYKIKLVLVSEFIFGAHNCLKVRLRKLQNKQFVYFAYGARVAFARLASPTYSRQLGFVYFAYGARVAFARLASPTYSRQLEEEGSYGYMRKSEVRGRRSEAG